MWTNVDLTLRVALVAHKGKGLLLLPEQRRRKIVSEIFRTDFVRTDDLVTALNVSVETVRRDLIGLERQGALRRVHGGAARTVAADQEPTHQERSALNRESKIAIARAAARLVRPGDTVILDVGTTVELVASNLSSAYHGRVITNSLSVASRLAHRPEMHLTVVGGDVRPGDLACSGPSTVDLIGNFHANVAFLASGGVDAQWGLMDFYEPEAHVRRAMIEQADRSYVVVDSSKIGVVAPFVVTSLDRLTGLITDTACDLRLLDELRQTGLDIIVAD